MGMLKEFGDSMRDALLIRQSFLDLRDNFRMVVDPTLQSNTKGVFFVFLCCICLKVHFLSYHISRIMIEQSCICQEYSCEMWLSGVSTSTFIEPLVCLEYLVLNNGLDGYI